MIGATDGSPLYLDDLLKLAKVVSVRDAIQIWIDKKGDEARKYALQRELETLRDDAKKVLIAAAVNEDPVSAAELEQILRFPQDRLISALSELQDLFLLPKAQVAEGERRFQLNSNTRRLVRSVEGDSDLYNRIARESKALAGKLPQVGRGIIASMIRQAQIRMQAGQQAEAVKLLKDAIERYPHAPDLRGFLGNVYRRLGRIVDAREQFEEAYKRKANNTDMFLRWIKMEIGEGEWSKAVKVGDRALKAVPTLYPVVEYRVFSKRQAGFDLSRGLHYEKAEKWWREAVQGY